MLLQALVESLSPSFLFNVFIYWKAAIRSPHCLLLLAEQPQFSQTLHKRGAPTLWSFLQLSSDALYHTHIFHIQALQDWTQYCTCSIPSPSLVILAILFWPRYRTLHLASVDFMGPHLKQVRVYLDGISTASLTWYHLQTYWGCTMVPLSMPSISIGPFPNYHDFSNLMQCGLAAPSASSLWDTLCQVSWTCVCSSWADVRPSDVLPTTMGRTLISQSLLDWTWDMWQGWLPKKSEAFLTSNTCRSPSYHFSHSLLNSALIIH